MDVFHSQEISLYKLRDYVRDDGQMTMNVFIIQATGCKGDSFEPTKDAHTFSNSFEVATWKNLGGGFLFSCLLYFYDPIFERVHEVAPSPPLPPPWLPPPFASMKPTHFPFTH
jgi:hypothetical protein